MNKKLKFLIGFLITVSLIVFLLKQIDLNSFVTIIKNIPLNFLILGFIFYAISYLFRALRFKFLFNHKFSLGNLFTKVSVYNLFNSVMPMRTGEFSFIYLIKREKMRGTLALAILMIARIFDFIFLSIFFFLSIYFLKNVSKIFISPLLLIALILVLLIFSLISLIYFKDHFIKFSKKLFEFFKLTKFKFIRYILDREKYLIKSLRIIKGPKKVIQTSIFSLGIWLSQFMMVFILLTSFGINLNFWSAVLALIFISFAFILPIQGIGGFGTLEGLWALALISLGINKEIAISSGFALHFITILYYAVLGIVGLIFLKKSKGKIKLFY